MGVPIGGIIPLLVAGVAAYLMPGLGWAPFLIFLTVAFMAVGLWPEYVTALIFFTLAMLLHVCGPDAVFAGFCSSAFWLILSGFFLGQAVTITGFGSRIAAYVARVIPSGYAWSITGMALMAVGMSFLMPSAMGRTLLMLPIIKDLSAKLGYREGGRGYTGITLTGLLCTLVPAMSILPANIPNMVLVGSAEAVGLPRPDYAHYLLLHFPALGFLKAVLICVVIGWIFRPGKAEEAEAASIRSSGVVKMKAASWSNEEIKIAVVLFGCLAMWCTDSLHGISPAWVGMVAAIFCLLPFSNILDPQKAVRELSIGSLFYVAAIISIGVVVSQTGMGERIATGVLAVLPLSPASPFMDFNILGLLSVVLGPVTTQPGIPAVLTPMATHLAAASGLSPYAVMMTQVLGFSTYLFPFQTAPLMVGMHILKFPIMQGTKLLFLLAGISIVLLWPVEYLVWWLCGVV